ncbi:integrase core domain-containing protein [Mobilicoccus pelagius]|uniref:integrase core domain-containing protein n=1 Tax=Mobilicoccus pelagius TaxID=746032 RepID=UPI000A05EA57
MSELLVHRGEPGPRPESAVGVAGGQRAGVHRGDPFGLAHRAGREGVIPPGQPWKCPFAESFNVRLRGKCLSLNQLWSLTYARVGISDWTGQYNQERPHSALGYLALALYAAGITTF